MVNRDNKTEVRMVNERRIHPPANPQMRQVDVQVYGERNLPLGRARIPIDILQDFEAAWLGWKAKYPSYTMEQFLRYVVRRGTIVAVRRVLLNSIPSPESLHNQIEPKG